MTSLVLDQRPAKKAQSEALSALFYDGGFFRFYNNDMRILISLVLVFLYAQSVWARPAVKIEDTTNYKSGYDESLTFKRLTFLPSIDNVNNVHAKAINEKLESIIVSNHQWDFVKSNVTDSIVRPEDIVGDPKKVLKFSKHLQADGFFLGELRKDPKETRLHLYFFSSQSGELVTEASKKIQIDTTAMVKAGVLDLANRIRAKIPYDALILSRTDNRITINAGSQDGVRVGQNLSAVKIIGAKKHPKRGFIIKSEKALLGQIRVVKADKYLSFADIVSESEPGVITKNVKITGISQVSYEATPWTKTYTPPEQLLSENNKPVFGKNASAWVAKDPPTFGKISADFSLGSFDNSLGFSDGSSIGSDVSVYPRVNLEGEIWVTPKLYTNFYFAQGIGSSGNPGPGAPELSNSLTQYRLSFGYNFILRNEFFGPRLTFDFGLSSYQMFVDTTSTTGFTSLEYNSWPIGIGGYVPINPSRTWAIGGKAFFHLFPRLKEKPFTSGSSPSSNINQFMFYAENTISQRLRWRFGLEFLLLNTRFSGGGARPIPASNTSHRLTMASTGVSYLF